MKVLQICHKVPFPPNDGGTLAMYQLAKAMLELGWEVKNISLATHKHPFNEMPTDEVFSSTAPESVRIHSLPSFTGVLTSYIKKSNYLVSRFYSERFSKLIEDTLNSSEFDMVICEGAYMAQYIEAINNSQFKGLKILRAHNVEFHLWEDRLRSEKGWVKKHLLKSMIQELQEYELTELKKFDKIACISVADKAFFNSYLGKNKAFYLPFGISLPPQTMAKENITNDLVFLGALDWDPNIEGLQWFLNLVWPEIKQKNPKITFTIAGRNASEELIASFPENVNFIGEVEDAHDFISSGKILIVPLLSGSGIRIKIIEGLALGQVIVTTPKGASGITPQSDFDFIVCDNHRIMVRRIQEILSNSQLHQQIGVHGRKLAELQFNILNTQKVLTTIKNGSIS